MSQHPPEDPQSPWGQPASSDQPADPSATPSASDPYGDSSTTSAASSASASDSSWGTSQPSASGTDWNDPSRTGGQQGYSAPEPQSWGSAADPQGYQPQQAPQQPGGYPPHQGYASQDPYQQQGGQPGYPPQQGYPPQPGYPQPAYPNQPGYQPPLSESDAKLWSVLVHIAPLITGFVGPLIIWLIFKDRGELIKGNSTEALNWSILASIAMVVSSILTVVIIGAVLIPLVGIAMLVFGILGALAANRGEVYRYPLNWRLVK